MGKKWDYDVPSVEIWKECLRVLKPGGHLISFAGSRTYHRMAVNIEDAGFEIRDQIMWVYGSGFPKSHNISKAIDKMITTSSTKEAKQWDGWGTALKPAHEPIVMARKPLSEKTVAKNVLKWGTGGINIDDCRVEGRERTEYGLSKSVRTKNNTYSKPNPSADFDATKGRFPANFIHDDSKEVTEGFPQTTKAGNKKESILNKQAKNVYGKYKGEIRNPKISGDIGGSASRFFYCAKASKKDRDEGNKHPTVKPTELMKYLVRLVSPPKGIVLDPFMGSGSTGKACVIENFNFIGIEKEKEYFDISKERIENCKKEDKK
jgi:site-specific DNA-methyltransferase (adenine-specific)